MNPPKKSNTTMIIIIVIVVVLCCCCLVIVGGYATMGPAINNVFSSVNQGLNNPGAPSLPGNGTVPTPNISIPSSQVPSGGKGDDIQRAEAWGYVVTASALNACYATDASKTTIAVTTQPDSSGAWQEKWTVACSDGSNKSYDVSFTPGGGGTTTVVVNPSK
jgi:hypothetical protein